MKPVVGFEAETEKEILGRCGHGGAMSFPRQAFSDTQGYGACLRVRANYAGYRLRMLCKGGEGTF
jgi:hypothetical protein